jgi:predicted PolB exonuclease-like 3'-5' exonuclease
LSDLTFSTAPKNGGKLGNRHKKFGGKPKNGIKKIWWKIRKCLFLHTKQGLTGNYKKKTHERKCLQCSKGVRTVPQECVDAIICMFIISIM